MKDNFLRYEINNDVFKCSIIAYSKIGLTHSKSALPNQDSFGCFTFEKKIAIAVADGVGSCKYSQYGAKAAVQIIKELSETLTINKLTDIEIKEYIVSNWKSKIQNNADDFATTLRFVIVSENDIIIGEIGDGLTMFASNEKFYSFENGGIFVNQTLALRDNTQLNDFNIYHINKKSEILISIMTDGVSNELDLSKNEEFMQYLKLIMAKDIAFENELISWIDSLNSKNGDDKTIVMMLMYDCNNHIMEEKL